MLGNCKNRFSLFSFFENPQRSGSCLNKYSNAICPVCGKPFSENDDIVICPDCGAPHHRECYRRLGHCALIENHKLGKIGNLLPGPNQNPAHRSNVPAVEQKTQRTGSFAAAAAHAWPAKHKPVTGIPLLFISALLLAVEFPHMASPMGILMEVRILMKKWAA